MQYWKNQRRSISPSVSNTAHLWKWLEIIIAAFVLFSCSINNVTASSERIHNGNICQRKFIGNTADLKELRGCRVIEGSLQIRLIEQGLPQEYKNLSFPDLREITGYFLVWEVKNLTTLGNIFPNLAVIRGHELIHSYALLIRNMGEMQEIGLPALTNIERGSVWINDNPHLCYVDTIDWNKIVNDKSESNNLDIQNNKPSEQCPNTCPSNCTKSDNRPVCWSNTLCQVIDSQACKNKSCLGPCSPSGECCNPECLGGCTGTGPHECFVCKNVYFKEKCLDACPATFYEYLQRRCVTKQECWDIEVPNPTDNSKPPSRGKLYQDKSGKLSCLLKCSKDTELSPDGKRCIPCDGACKKVCEGLQVDSIAAAKMLAGCTRIKGALMIKIRGSAGGKARLVKELKENLDKIEEIDNYLVITYTYSIYSLDFLENLKRIRGLQLDQGYAVIIKSNDNLVELWNSTSNPNRTITIENKEARVLFHYNPKLCPNKIWEFVNQAGIVRPKDDKIDIGITNGDKVPCNTRRLIVQECRKSNSSVTIRFENFRRNLTQTHHLLNYEVSYKEAPDYPRKNVSIYDDRDPCGEDDWSILDVPKIPDDKVRGVSQEDEPPWEDERIINGLKHFTWYALYVKTIVIPDETSPNNNTGAQSDLIYFQTLPDTPRQPLNVDLTPIDPFTVRVTWEPPTTPNGVLDHFKILLKEQKENQNFLDQRDFCHEGRTEKSFSFGRQYAHLDSIESTSGKTTLDHHLNEKECCSCSAPTFPGFDKTKQRSDMNEEWVKLHEDVDNAMMNAVFIKFPQSKKGESNDISKSESRRRRRRQISTSEDSSESKAKVFPGEHHEPNNKPPIIDWTNTYEMKYNPDKKQYEFTLPNLTHYTTYTIGVQVCRQPAESRLFTEACKKDTRKPSNPDNDTDATLESARTAQYIESDLKRNCSEIVYGRNAGKSNFQTMPSPSADEIDVRTVTTNVTGNKLHLRWEEPKRPNGVVMAYVVVVKRVDGSGEHGSHRGCITRKKFQEAGHNFTLPDILIPGNYSVKIQVVSLAMDSNFTELKYFNIVDSAEGELRFWLLVIMLPLMLLICLCGLLTFYYIRRNGFLNGQVVKSTNPVYIDNVDIPERWEVPRDKIELLKDKSLGQGSFGMVFEGKLKDFDEKRPLIRCAIKTVAEDATSEDRHLFLKEAELMTKLSCHHLVKLLGVVSKTQPTYVIMELMVHGDLKNYLRARRPDSPYNGGEPPPTLKQILRIACEIADGLAYIHSHNYVHRDLAARNCMVADDMSVKVGDFGMTKDLLQTDYYRKQTRGLLPVRWMAPESLRDGVFTNQTDVWSFGVVLWEMATSAAQPYQGLSNSQVLLYVQGGGTMERPDNCPEILYNLMMQCWDFDCRLRPTFTDILENLTQDVDTGFARVSFFHSREGQEFKYLCKNRPVVDEACTVRTPLRATMDEIESDLDDYDSDEDRNIRLQDMIDDLNSEPSRYQLPTSPTMTTTGSIPTNTTTSMLNGLALTPVTSGGNKFTSLTNNNNRADGSLSDVAGSASLQSTQPMPNITTPILKPFTNNSNAFSNPGDGNYSKVPGNPGGGFISLNLSPNNQAPTSSSSSSTPNGLENPNVPHAKFSVMIPNSQSSGQISSNNSRVNNNSSNNSNANSNSASTPNSAPPGSNESSKALSISHSPSDGNKVSNGGTNVNLGNVSMSSAGGTSTGGNGYITLRHSPVYESHPKSNKTSQF